MAERRMFTKKITDSDAFTEMSSAAQALYFHLNQAADDDGFNNQIQMAMIKAHASIDDLKILMAKNFVIRFESGVIVIKHWRMHNTLRKDRYTPTNYQEELSMLGLKGNGTYSFVEQGNIERLPSGCQTVAAGKYSLGKYSLGKCSVVEGEFKPVGDGNVLLTSEQIEDLQQRLGNDTYERYVNRLSGFIQKNNANVANHYGTILKWYQEDTAVSKEKIQRRASGSFDTDEFFAAAVADSFDL